MNDRMRVLSYKILESTKAMSESESPTFTIYLAECIIRDSVELSKIIQNSKSSQKDRKKAA